MRNYQTLFQSGHFILHFHQQCMRVLILHIIANTCSVQFSSVAQSRPTLCDPVNCSMPGLPVHHQLLEFTQTHVHYKHGNEYDHSLVLIYIFLMAINAENIFMFLLAICIILETCLFQSLIPFLIWLSF